MIAFNEKDIAAIRERAKKNPRILNEVEKNTANIRKKLYIQKNARATWSHYFVCPKHSVGLTFDYDSPLHYTCPVDGEVFTGEPYEGGWWDKVLLMNANHAYTLAVAYMATSQEDYLKTVKEMLLGYATYYPGYEVHGDIPYNHPGKFASQVLEDSICFNNLACAYDIVKDNFTPKEQALVEENLLLEGAKYIQSQVTKQIHNHEVCNNSTLGIIGLILNRKDLIESAINEKYGLKYQLDHGVLADGLWFEGTPGYHNYVLLWLLNFERFARYTEYSLLKDPHYRDILKTMMTYFNRIMQADLSVPMLNDGSDEGGFSGKSYIYEYGCAVFPDDEEIRWSLKQMDLEEGRDTVHALLYGMEDVSDVKEHACKTYLAQTGSNLAVLHGKENRYLLFKALPYGGEHDHYDRLAICFHAFGKKLCPDLGTAKGYGAPLHYAYYKNTATHNTVAINGDNMPPVNTKVNCYRENREDDIYLDAQINFAEEMQMPDSFVIPQWNEESYQGAFMRRIIQWYGNYFVDVFVVDAANTLNKDWIFHINGKRLPVSEEHGILYQSISDKNPQKHLHDVTVVEETGMIQNVYDCGDDVYLSIHTLADGKKMMYGFGPNNPSGEDISYLIERTTTEKTVYVNIIEAYRKEEEQIAFVEASVAGDSVQVIINEQSGEKKELTINL